MTGNENIPSKPLLIIIGGPTASGKTSLAIQIAKHFNAEILSADSRQIYKELTIGTAKPSNDELLQAPHHFISHVSIHKNYDAGKYADEALERLRKIFSNKNIAVMVGGTGLYIKAVINGLDEFPPVDEVTKISVREQYESKGLKWLQDEIKKLDESYFYQVDINNPMRLLRALEVCLVSGKPYSSLLSQPKNELPFDVLKIAIDMEREELYQRINKRVIQMIQQGLVDEAEHLFEFKHLQALQTVGYKELFDCFDKNISKAEAIELIQQNTRNYAKRQLTWFRKEKDWHWIKHSNFDVIDFIETKIQNGNH